VPWIISEFGYSPFSTRDEVTMPGAIVNAETVAEFLTIGGYQANLYGYPPGMPTLDRTMAGATWGDLIALLADDDGNIRAKLPAYWASWLLTNAWTKDPSKAHQLFTASVIGAKGTADPLIAAFPVRRPDGRWALLLLNKDAHRSRHLQVRFDGAGRGKALDGEVTVWQYGSAQYAWKDAERAGAPTRSLPPSRTVMHTKSAGATVDLAPFSICVVEM